MPFRPRVSSAYRSLHLTFRLPTLRSSLRTHDIKLIWTGGMKYGCRRYSVWRRRTSKFRLISRLLTHASLSHRYSESTVHVSLLELPSTFNFGYFCLSTAPQIMHRTFVTTCFVFLPVF